MTIAETQATDATDSGRFRPLAEDQRVSAAVSRRVCIATDDIVGPVRNGGIGTAYSSLAQVLAAAGCEVTILYTAGQVCESESLEHWIEHYARIGVRLVPLPALQTEVGGSRALALSYSIYDWLKARDFDIVHFPDWQGRAFYTCLAKRQGLALPNTLLCLGTHGPRSWNRIGNGLFPKSDEQLEIEFMERQSVEMADVVVSPSKFMLDWMRTQGWHLPERAYVHQNILLRGSDNGLGAESAPHALNEVVFFGRLEKRKGLELFCGALDRLATTNSSVSHNLIITFLGKSGEIYDRSGAEYVRQCAAQWPWRVQMVSELDHRQAIEYLRQPGRLAVIASLTDNSPYTVLECLGERIPFIASNVGGIAELIAMQDQQRVCFQPSESALADKLLWVAGHAMAVASAAESLEATREAWVDWHRSVQLDVWAHKPGPEPATEPLVSVCLLHFNRPNYLRYALESLHRQDYRNFEVVLVDDGSTDPDALHFLDALEPDFQARGWTILREENRFRGAARNAAARAARGEYLLFMDDDNCAKPNEISTFVRAALNTDTDICTCFMEMFSGDDAPRPDAGPGRKWLFLGGCAALGLIRNCFGDTNALIKASAYQQLQGFGEEYGMGHEDWELFGRAVLNGFRLQVVPEALFWYRHSDVGRERRDRNAYKFHMNSLTPYLSAVPDAVKDLLLLAHGQNAHRAAPPDPRASADAISVKALIKAACVLGLRGDVEASMDLFKEAMNAAQLSGQDNLVIEVLLNTSKLLADTGRWTPALQLANDALETAANAAHAGAVLQARELKAYIIQASLAGLTAARPPVSAAGFDPLDANVEVNEEV